MYLNAPTFDFRSGILSKKILNRLDLKIVKSGILQGLNFTTQVQGSQDFRWGFKYVCRTRRNLPATLWPFVFNDDQAFVLAFTDYYLRFYAKEGVITETAKNITAATNASPGVFTSVGHGYVTGNEIFVSGVGGMTEVNGQFFLVVRINNDTYSLQDLDGNAINTTSYGAYTSGGTTARVYEIATPYTQVQAENLMDDGKADVRYLVDGVHMPRKLTRLSNTNWTLATFTRTNDPFEQKAITDITAANPANVEAVGHGRTTGDQVFIEDIPEGGPVALNNRTFTITVVDPDNYTLDGENSTGYPAYVSGGIATLQGNAPRAVGLFASCIFYGGSDNDPEVFHKSMSPDTASGATRYEDFTLGSDPEDAVTLPITSTGEGVPRIRFFVGTRNFLAVGTFGGMSKINGGADTVPITGKDIQTFPVDSVGVAPLRPIAFGNDILYTQRGTEFILSFQYSISNDGYDSFDTMLASDELSGAGIRQLAYQQGTPSLMWVCLQDGDFLSLTYRRTEAITAWNNHKTGGDGQIISLCGEPQETNKDRLWACVKRNVDGVDRYYMEVSALNPTIPEFKDFYTGAANRTTDRNRYLNMLWEAQRRLVFLDSALTFDTTQSTTLTPGAGATVAATVDVPFTAGAAVFSADSVGQFIYPKYILGTESGIALITEYVSPTVVKCQIRSAYPSLSTIASGGWYLTKTTIAGLNHLEGEEVTVVEDGALANVKTVENGEIELDDPACCGVIGLPYLGLIETMPIDLLLSSGVTVGKYKGVGTMKILFRNSLGMSYGPSPYDLSHVKIRTGDNIAGRPAPLYSGYSDLPGFGSYDIQRSMFIVQDKPFPCTVQGFVADVETPLGP